MRHVNVGGGEGGMQRMPVHTMRSSSLTGSGPHRPSMPQPGAAGGGERGAHKMSLHGAISLGSGPQRPSMPQLTGAGGGLAASQSKPHVCTGGAGMEHTY